MIASQLFEMEETVLTTRDSIITADDLTQTISRRLYFRNNENEKDDIESFKKAIEKVEDDFNLPDKLKNVIIPKTLTYGSYYVYTIPYSKLFERQYRRKVEHDGLIHKPVSESISVDFATSFKESVENDGCKILSKNTDIMKVFKSITDDISVFNEECSIPLIEGLDLSSLIGDDEAFKRKSDEAIKKARKDKFKINDGVIDTDKIDGMFDNYAGVYVKYIDPRRIIPVKILDHTLGYYYIHDTNVQFNKANFTSAIKFTNSSFDNVRQLEDEFVSKIADAVVRSFDKPFLDNNVKFKELIANALIYNDMYKKDVKFQFIPKEYMTEFKVNEDDDGNGTSILTKSLFYAKLYLSLLLFKMDAIVSKSNDTRVYYVKNSGMEQNITNQVQSVARTVKSKQMNITDLLNYRSMTTKIGASKEMFIPLGRSGERGIEFDIISGQDVQLNTDLMEFLRTNMINGTGVPSVILNYVNEADYAKTLVMANAKFVGRVVSFQLDFNKPITELIKKIVKFSKINIPEELMIDFIYTLIPPKSLNLNNTSDLINVADVIASSAIKSKVGDSKNMTEEMNIIKDAIYFGMMKELVPSINWKLVDQLYDDALLDIEKDKAKGITVDEE